MRRGVITIYSSSFNILAHKFDYEFALKGFCDFGDEVVIAVNTSNDGTLEALKEWKKNHGANHLRLIETSVSYDNPHFDGLIKNAALQATTLPRKVHLDLDEIIPFRQKSNWEAMFKDMEDGKYMGAKALLVPSLDLYGDHLHIPWDSTWNYKYKFYCHLELIRNCFWGPNHACAGGLGLRSHPLSPDRV